VSFDARFRASKREPGCLRLAYARRRAQSGHGRLGGVEAALNQTKEIGLGVESVY
jgi:hypothetical protein